MQYSKLIFIGTGSLLQNCMKNAMSAQLPIICVEPEKKEFGSLKNFCATNNIEFHLMTDKKELSSFFSTIDVSCLVLSIHNGYIFSKAAINNGNIKIINFHNSLLPKHPGRNSPTWAIYDMDEYAGITWHEVVYEVDKGGIVCQKNMVLTDKMTGMSVTKACVDLGLASFKEIFPSLLSNTYAITAQPVSGGDPMHYSYHVPNDGQLDTAWPGEKISAFLRSMDYGIFPPFGKPKVYFDNVNYEVEKYNINTAAEIIDDKLSLDGDQLVIYKNGIEIVLKVKTI